MNVFSMINHALTKLELKMSETETANFFEKYITPMSITFAKNGSAVLQNKTTLKD